MRKEEPESKDRYTPEEQAKIEAELNKISAIELAPNGLGTSEHYDGQPLYLWQLTPPHEEPTYAHCLQMGEWKEMESDYGPYLGPVRFDLELIRALAWRDERFTTAVIEQWPIVTHYHGKQQLARNYKVVY